MSQLSLKIFLSDFGTTKTTQYMSDMFVSDVCQDIRDKFNYGEGGLDHGLLFKDLGIWLNPQKMLGHYDLKYQSLLEFRKKHRVLKVRTLDGSVKAILIDESQPVSLIVSAVCQRIGIVNPEEYSFEHDVTEASDAKVEKKKKGDKPAAEKWLNPDKTFREQGLSELDTVVLKKKFFFSDQNVDRSDPVQLVLMYNQARDMIVSGKHPCTLEEAAQFGGIQLQVEVGNHEQDKHKSGFIKLKTFAPPEYLKSKDLEKKIYAEHRKLQGTTDLNAKFRYVQLIRSMKTYGVSFFFVKEPATKEKRKCSVLLGITKQSVVRMDTISKDVLQEWKLTQIRRWAATPKGFTLDFGEYADKYYNVETEEGEQISRLISGYIDIIIKKRNQLSIAPDSSLQEQAIVEDYVSPGQAQNISMYNGEHAQQSDGRANNFAAQQSREIEYSTNGELPVDLELMQALEYLKAKLQAALGVLSACNRDMYTATHLTYLGPDSQAKKWKTETREINSAAAASYITAEIAALSSLLISCTGETKDMDFDAIDSYISSIVSSISQVTGSWRILAGLLPDEESQNLLVMGQNLVESTAEFLTGIEGTISNQESSTVLHHVGTEVSNIAANALLAIGELDVTQDEQQLLIDAASNVINGISDVVAAADEIIKSLADDARMDAFNQDIEVALQVAPILETSASMLAIAIKTPLCRERLIEIAILVRDVLTAIESHEIEDRSDELLHNFKQGIQECEEALAFLVEKARNIENDIDYDIEAHYDQVVGVVDDLIKWLDEPKKATAYGKELVVNSTRLVEVFKMKIDSLEAGEEQESLAKDLESLSETILAMVQAIRSIKDFVNQDSATFVDSVNDLRDLTMLISEPYLKANTAKKLINALKSTLSASNQVVSAAKNVAPSNRDQASQLQLYKAGKEVTDKLPGLLKLIRETRANPREFVNRYKLLMGCKSFCSPAMALLSTAKSASSTTVEAGYQVQLLGAAQHLAEEIIYLQRLCNQMEAIMSEEDFTCANQSIKEIQENIRSISILGAENPQIVSADDNIDIGVQSQKLRSAIHELASSIQKGTFQAPHLDLVKFIAEYRAILSPLYAAILACDEATREILIQNANDLGDAVTLLIENQKDDKIIKTSITSADNAIRLILAHQPDQQSISIAQQAIHRLACNLKAGRASQKSDRSERPERLIWVAATKLLTISNSFVDACGDERGYQDLGKGVETFVNCFENMVDAVGIVSAKSSSTEMKATSENVTKLGENCNEFLGAINSTLSDSQSAAAKLNLFASMAKIQEVVDSILDSLSMSLPGQKQLEKASDLFKSMNLAISSNISESPAPDTSLAENFGKVSQHSHTMAQNLASVKNSINEGNPEAMATAVLQLVGSLQAVIQASSNTNQLIASHDTNVKPGVVGLDSAPYVASIDKIKNAMTAVLIPEQKQSKLLQDVSVIAAESARIRNMIKQAINGSDVSDAKKESLNAALASLISAIPPYVNSLKALTANSNDATVAACKAAGSPLLSVMDQISAELNPLPILSVETISKCTAVHQASKTLVDQGRAIHMAVQNLCAISDDKSLRDILIHEVEQLGRINLAFVNVVKETVPGQKQCENAQSQILSSQKLIAEARIGLASGSSSVNSSPDDLQSLKSGIEILANLMSLMKRNVRSELSTTLEAVAQVERAALGIASSNTNENNESLLNLMENLGKSVSKIIDTVRLDAAAPTEATIMALISSDNAFNACMKEIKSSECLATDKVSLAASQAMKEIEEAFSDIHNSLVAAKGDHAAISHFDKSSNLLIHQIQQNSQSDRTNAPEKLSMLSGVYKNVLKNALSCAKSTNDQVLQQNVVEQIRELGGSTLKFFELLLKPEISDIDFRKRKNLIIREISQETSNLNAVLLEGLIGIQAGQKMRDDVDLIITEVESCLIFAQAKQLNPDGESGKAFTTSVKDIILQEAQGLTELVKGYVTEIQNQTSQKDVADLFVKTNTSLQATINACIQGASCLSSDESEKQEKLLAISAELGESTKSMIMAFQQANFDQSMTGDFKKSAALELDTINKLVTIVKSLGDASEEFNHNISELTQSIDNDLQTLKNNDPALGSALPADLVHISRQLAAAVINVIGSVAGNEQDLFAKMGKVVNTISDLTRTAKASVSGAPEDQKSIVLDSAAELSQSCRAFISEVGSTLHVALVPRKQALNLKIKDITAAVASVAQSAASLIPTGYEDPNDPNVIAERELLTAANAIEAAAKKLSLLKPAEKPREANQELNFEEQIVEAAKAIASASSALVRSATGVQREIMSKGKVVNLGSKGMYHEDGTWREGLVSAARLVVEATQSLYEAANEAAKNVLDIEFVIVSAKAVSSATVQLITAASVKADPNSKAHMKLKSAGKSVTDATDMLVLAAKSANCEPNTLADEKPLEAAPASTKTKVAEMDTMVNILRMEKELERARQSLATMRRGKYTQQTQAEVSVKDQQPRTTQHVSRQSIIVRQGVAARQSILAPKSGEESPARVQSKRLSRMID